MLNATLLLFSLLAASTHAAPPSSCESPLARELATAEAEPQNLVDVLIRLWPRGRKIFDRLNAKYRRGWQRIGIPDVIGETVLDHTFNVVRAARIYARMDPTFEVRRGMWMALIHDVPEWRVPDWTPYDGISLEEKFQREHFAMNATVAWMGGGAQKFEDMWLEFERGNSREAVIVRQFDKLDVIPTACEYERRGYDASSFFDNIDAKITDPFLRRVLDEMMSMRGTRFVDFRAAYLESLGRR